MRAVLVSVLSVGVLGLTVAACTRTLEQPQAAQAPPPPESNVAVARPKPRPFASRPALGLRQDEAPAASDAAAPSAAQAAEAPTLNGDPKGPQREQLSKALDDAMPSLANCFEGGGGSIGVAFEADPSGRATNLKISGAAPSAERCVRDTIAAVRLPSFEGRPVPVNFPVTVRTSTSGGGAPAAEATGTNAAPPAPPPPDKAPSGGPASVFVQP